MEDKFKNMHMLDRSDRLRYVRDLERLRPDFLKPYYPGYWWWRRCVTKVLIVCDGGLNFGTGIFGLSEFLTTFNELEAANWWTTYQVTLAHRSTAARNPNPVIVRTIDNFRFDTGESLDFYDQIWLFGIESGPGLDDTELIQLHAYMDDGGGLFATGDHGSLGSALCGNINRVKDMRHWNDTTMSQDTSEVSMTGRRRNDTNRPAAGASTSRYFDNQSDEIPQNIAPHVFDNGLPHPILSIRPALRASGIIDIMPDHPHEGECKPETTFTVSNVPVSTQIIATSSVLGGSTIANGNGKALTDAHTFPSISVWDGRQTGKAGRIVVDSTWHHFVNINLNGENSSIDSGLRPGLTDSDFRVVRQYYMNIATWVSRHKATRCGYRYQLYDLLVNSQLIEASLNNPAQSLQEISLADLNSIGALAEEVLSNRYSPAFARTFLLDLMNDFNPGFSNMLNSWKASGSPKKKEQKSGNDYYQPWIKGDIILWTSIGAGFIALRDDKSLGLKSEKATEKNLADIIDVFTRGMAYGYDQSGESLNRTVAAFTKKLNRK